ncbi:MAG: DUF3352 domain-containing protein [Candidatus Omnitrophota bacterium]
MKKSIIAVICAAIAACAGYAYFSIFAQKPVVFESIVPDSAIYYVATSNLNKKFRDFKNSTFFLQLSGTSLYKKNIGPKLDELDSKAPFLKDFTDKDISLAVLSLGKAPELKQGKKYDLESAGDILLLIRVDKNKLPQLKRTIAEAYIAKYKCGIVSSGYQGVRISSLKAASGEEAINYTILSDTVLISNSLEDIRKSIDLFKKKNAQSLANNPGFRQATARVKKDSLFWGYKNSKNYYAAYLRQVQETTDPLQKIIMSQMQPVIGLMAAFKDAAFYVDYDQEAAAFVSRSYTMFDASKDESGLIGIIARDKALDQKVFSLIPKDALGYYACNQDMLKCYDFGINFLSSIFGAVNLQASSKAGLKGPSIALSPDTIIRQAEYYLGVDLRKDLIALMGDDFGLVFAGLGEVEVPQPQNINRRISFPQLYLFCGAKDGEKLGKTMEGIFQKIAADINTRAVQSRERYKKAKTPEAGSSEEEGDPLADEDAPAAQEEEKPLVVSSVENHNGVDIHYLEFANSSTPFVQPNYCIVDKYLVFSISRDLTRKVIQTYKSGSGSFDPDTDLAPVKDNLPPGYSAMFYLDFRSMVNNLAHSSSFKKFQPMLINNPKLGLSSGDLDLVIAALSTMRQFIATVHKIPGEDALESQGILTIEE